MREKTIFFLIIFSISFFFSTYKLTESPPTWYDEGFFFNVARSYAEFNEYKFQVAPGEFVPMGRYLTVGYPVIFPVSISMKLAGVGLFQERAVMAAFILLLVCAVFFFFLRRHAPAEAFLFTLFFISFGSLYGNGKNLLGEIPGIFFLTAFLLFFNLLLEKNRGKMYFALLAGTALGLGILCKPIFILVIPAFIITFLILRKDILLKITRKHLVLFLAAVLVPLLAAIFIQFNRSDDSLLTAILFYMNPAGWSGFSEVPSIIMQNLLRLVTGATPLHFLLLLAIWTWWIVKRVRCNSIHSLPPGELFTFLFVILVGFAYLRTLGWYKYFFPAHMMVFLYFPAALKALIELITSKSANVILSVAKNLPLWAQKILHGAYPEILHFVQNDDRRVQDDSGKSVLLATNSESSIQYLRGRFGFPNLFQWAFIVIIVIQFYHLVFLSWVSGYYSSTQSKELSDYFSGISHEESVFIHSAPEAVLFVPSSNYYLYLDDVMVRNIGAEQLEKLASGVPDVVIIPTELIDSQRQYLAHYRKEKELVGQYTVLRKAP